MQQRLGTCFTALIAVAVASALGCSPSSGDAAAAVSQHLASSQMGPVTIAAGQSVAANGLVLAMQPDGGLALRGPNGLLWSSQSMPQLSIGQAGCPSGSSCTAAFQGDGNLVLYGPSGAYWSSDSAGHPGATLELSASSPYLTIRSAGGAAVWDTTAYPAGPTAPRIADGDHLVVMQYETWFSPISANFENTAAVPLLSSESMKRAGLKGYDSLDRPIIVQHESWMRAMGVDAVEVDLTNAAACTFNDDVGRFCDGANDADKHRNKAGMIAIRDNLGNLFTAYHSMNSPLRIIPLIDGQDPRVFDDDGTGTTAFEKELRYFQSLLVRYPAEWVIYQGKPLLSIYAGVPARDDLMQRAQAIIDRTALGGVFTIRFSTGYTDSQPERWAQPHWRAGLPMMNTNIWSWTDRMIPSAGKMPTYSVSNGTVENFTATSAFEGIGNAAWGDWSTRTPFPTSGLRGNGEVFRTFMKYARSLAPTLLFVNQFNEYEQQDQGWDANTTNDLEPANLWGSGPMQMATQEIALYKSSVGSAQTAIVGPGYFQVSGAPAVYYSNGTDAFCSFASWEDFLRAGGAADLSNVLQNVSNVPTDMRNDGKCFVAPDAPTAPTSVREFRFWKSGDRLVTASLQEGYQAGYTLESSTLLFYSSADAAPGLAPVYRCFSPNGHFVSMVPGCEGFPTDTTLGYLSPSASPGTLPIYRLWNAATGSHMISYDPNEGASAGFAVENVLGYGPPS